MASSSNPPSDKDMASSSNTPSSTAEKLAQLFVSASLFAKPSEIDSAVKSNEDVNEEQLALVSYVGNIVNPPKHEKRIKKKMIKDSKDSINAWLDSSSQQVNEDTHVSYADLTRTIQNVTHSSYMQTYGSEPDYRNCKIGVFWDFINCRAPDGFNHSAIVEKIKLVLVEMGYCGELEVYAVGDKRDFVVGNLIKSSEIKSELEKQYVTIVDTPKELRNETKEVGDKKIITKMVSWTQEYYRKHKEPGTILAITKDVDFRFGILSVRNYYFEFLLFHPRDADELLTNEVPEEKRIIWEDVVG